MRAVCFIQLNPEKSLMVTDANGRPQTLTSGNEYEIDDAIADRLVRDFPQWFTLGGSAGTAKMVHPEKQDGFIDKMTHPFKRNK